MNSSSKATRHALRTAAIQTLFQLDAQGDGYQPQVGEFLAEQGVTEDQKGFVQSLIEQCWSNRVVIDRQITEASKHWDLHRMTPIDRTILRLAIGELMYQPETPPKVVINEAIELAKTFGTAESPQFINGLLDAIFKKWKDKEKSSLD